MVDIPNQKLSEAYGILALKNDKGDFYMRSNCLNRLVGLGCFYAVGARAHHAAELQYDFFGKNKGINGLPLFFRWGGHYHLQNGAKLSSQLFCGSKWMVTHKLEVPLGKQTKVTVTDQADFLAAIKNPKSMDYKVGFAFEFKL